MKTRSILKLTPRRQFHRAFVKWFSDNQHRFPIELVCQRRTDRNIGLSFGDINPVIKACVHLSGLTVDVTWDDECWDLIGEWEASPKRFVHGYACTMCRDFFQSTHPGEEFVRYFETREKLWATDIFEPFLEWLHDVLVPARWIRLSRYKGTTRADLARERSDDDGGNDYQNRKLVNGAISLDSPGDGIDDHEDDLTLYLHTHVGDEAVSPPPPRVPTVTGSLRILRSLKCQSSTSFWCLPPCQLLSRPRPRNEGCPPHQTDRELHKLRQDCQ